MSAAPKYYLGTPMWSNRDWIGSLYPEGSRANQFLRHYASVFNTVEGNNTFYQLPNETIIERWHDQVPADFRFCFKFPREVTHDAMLRGDRAVRATRRFYEVLEPLRDRLGMVFLQLPPGFGPDDIEAFENFLPNLDPDIPVAVEVRNMAFYKEDTVEADWIALLSDHELNYGIFDTGTLHRLTDDAPAVIEAQRKKPAMPHRMLATAANPWVRYVGNAEVEPNVENLSRLAITVANWIEEGRTPFVFMHSPGDLHVPALCRCFHELLAKWIDLPAFPAFPGEIAGQSRQQLELF